MTQATAVLATVVLSLTAGCSKKMPPPLAGQRASFLMSSPVSKDSDPLRRYVAVRHNLVVETPEADVARAWESTGAFCGTIRCEIVSSSIGGRTPDAPPSGALSMRVEPADLQRLFDHLGKSGSVVQHSTDSEDKTGTVIDVEAEIRNLTGFRDSLRGMLAKPGGSLKDVMEVQRELARVQSQLDSLATRRKVLANETEKVAVAIAFRARRSVIGGSVFAPIAAAWRESGTTLSESLAFMITLIAALLPWLLLVVPGFWLLRRVIRKVFRKRQTPA